MFGSTFLFSAALWALPLAGLPLILHLLFRHKSPVVYFSTLRFVRASVQENATRKKVQRWLLLACRAFLLALLIWALAQPARKIASGIFSGGQSMAAAIVVDTSYSMLLEDQQLTLLQKADDTVQDLLRTELRDANVAIFRSNSSPSSADAPRLQAAEAYRGERWARLTPTPNPAPLADQIAAAAQMLAGSEEDRKCLIVITDAQQKEFPRPISALSGTQTILIDLHPPDVRTAAVTDVHTEPRQPRLGIGAEVVIDLAGRANDGREVKLSVAPADQSQGVANAMPPPPLPMARFDATGRAQLRTPLRFTDSSWLLVTASLSSSESLPWAARRSELVRIPPRQSAAVLTVGRANPSTTRLVRLALDPSEGQLAAWPIALREGPPKWDEAMVVALVDQWPDQATAEQMRDFVRGGRSLVLFVQPGLEDSWATLDPTRRDILAEILPSAPMPASAPDAAYHASIVRPNDEVLADVGNAADAEGRLVVTRLIRFVAADSAVAAIINAAPSDPDSGAKITGLLWRRSVGEGVVYTWATFPDRTCGNLRVWEIFPPALVNAVHQSISEQADINVELGKSLKLAAADVPAGAEVDLAPPGQEPVKVNRSGDQYIFSDASVPGLYAWQWHGGAGQGILGFVNVRLPAAEARLVYRPLTEIAPEAANVLAAHSLDEVRQRLLAMEEPRPQWTWPIAIVLLLLCAEALLGALPKRLGKKPPARIGGEISSAA